MADVTPDFDLLRQLLALDSPSGDEGALADWLTGHFMGLGFDLTCERFGNSVIVTRGERPAVAVFAHTDTTGFTLGYKRHLIPIGGPSPKPKERLRPIGGLPGGNRLQPRRQGGWKLGGQTDTPPGSRWVYATSPEWTATHVTSPYLDNRAGVWAALQALARCPKIAVAFTVGEEHSGQGAFVCARRLHETYGITQALIADITWHTAHIRCGRGVAVSLRDRSVPRQRFLNRVLTLADQSGLSWQREVESGGGSDGGSIERSGVPMDWAFVGAPEKKPHTSAECVNLDDLRGMAAMLEYLVNALTDDPLK